MYLFETLNQHEQEVARHLAQFDKANEPRPPSDPRARYFWLKQRGELEECLF